MKKIVNPSLDIDNEKRIVNDLITQNHSVEYKFKIEVVIPIHLPPNSKPGACKKVVDMVKEQLINFGGGCQTSNCEGSWIDDVSGKLFTEDCVMISTSANMKKWFSASEMLRSIIWRIQDLLHQKCVYVAIDGIPEGDPIDLVEYSEEHYSQLGEFQGIDPECIPLISSNYNHTTPIPIEHKYNIENVENLIIGSELDQSSIDKIASAVISALNKSGITGKDEFTNVSSETVQTLDRVVADAANLSSFGIEFDPWDELRLCEAALISGKIKIAENYALDLIESFEKISDKAGQVYSMRLLTRIYHRQGRSSEAKDIAEKCLDLCKRNKLELEFAKTLGNLAIIESYFGNKRQALRLMQNSILKMTELENHQGVARCHLNLGFHYRGLGDYSAAEKEFVKAKSIAESVEDSHTLVPIFRGLSGIYEARGDRKEAISLLTRGVEICNKEDFALLKLTMHSQLAHIYRRSGETDKAKIELNKILAKTREFGLPKEESSTLNSLAFIAKSEGDLRFSECLANESMGISRRVGNLSGIARSKQILGEIYHIRGEVPKSMQYYHDSLAIHEERDYQGGIAYVKGELSKLHLQLGEVELSLELIEQSLTISRRSTDLASESYYLNIKGRIFEGKGDYDNANYFFQQSLDCAKKVGTPGLEAEPLRYMGSITEIRGDLKGAEKLFSDAQKLYVSVGNIEGQAQILVDFARIKEEEGQVDAARSLIEESLLLREKHGYIEGQSECHNNLGVLLFNQKMYEEAKVHFLKSLEIDNEIGDKTGLSYSLENLGTIEEELGNLSGAEDLYNQSLAISRELKDKIGQANTLYVLGELKKKYDDEKSLIEAKSHLEEALNLTKSTGDVSRQEKVTKALDEF